MLSTETKSKESVRGVDSISGAQGPAEERCPQTSNFTVGNHAIKHTTGKATV